MSLTLSWVRLSVFLFVVNSTITGAWLSFLINVIGLLLIVAVFGANAESVIVAVKTKECVP